MRQKMVLLVSGILAAGALTLGAANSPVIGMVSSGAGQAGVFIDGARVSGNATLFDGSLVSAAGHSRLQLTTGTRLDLGDGSVVRVFASHALLQDGASEVQSTSGYSIDARTLRIQPSDSGSIARVRLDGAQRVLVTAVSAPVNVWNSNGILVARVMPETPMSFLPQAAASNAFSNTGCVVNKSSAAVFVDQTGNQVFELRSTAKGVDLRKYVGKRAQVTGTTVAGATPVQGATQVVSVTTIASATGASCSDVATRIGATTSAAGIAAGGAGGAVGAAAAGGAVAAGASTGVSAAVVGGVAAATAVAVGTTIGVVSATSSNTSP